jgi:hypothetical protein
MRVLGSFFRQRPLKIIFLLFLILSVRLKTKFGLVVYIFTIALPKSYLRSLFFRKSVGPVLDTQSLLTIDLISYMMHTRDMKVSRSLVAMVEDLASKAVLRSGKTTITPVSIPTFADSSTQLSLANHHIAAETTKESPNVPSDTTVSQLGPNRKGPVNGHWIINSSDTDHFKTFLQHGSDNQNTLCLLFIHGGGYYFGSSLHGTRHHSSLLQQFECLNNNMRGSKRLFIFSLDYPLCPDHVYPEALHSALDAYKWLSQEIGFKNIAVSGDSAGYTISFSFPASIKFWIFIEGTV